MAAPLLKAGPHEAKSEKGFEKPEFLDHEGKIIPLGTTGVGTPGTHLKISGNTPTDSRVQAFLAKSKASPKPGVGVFAKPTSLLSSEVSSALTASNNGFGSFLTGLTVYFGVLFRQLALSSPLTWMFLGIGLGGGGSIGDAAKSQKAPSLQAVQGKAKGMVKNAPPELKADAEALHTEAGALKAEETEKLDSVWQKLADLDAKIKTAQPPKTATTDVKEPKAADGTQEKIESLKSGGLMDAAMAKEAEGFLADPHTKAAVEHGLSTAAGTLNKKDKQGNPTPDPVLAYNQINAALLEGRTIQKSHEMGGKVGSLPADQVTFEWSEPDAKNPQKTVKRKIENDVPAFEGRIWELKRYPRKEYGPDNRQQATNYQNAISGKIPNAPFKTATIQISGNVHPEQIEWMKANTPDVEVLYTFRLPSGQDYVFALKPGSPDHPGLASQFPKPTNLSPTEAKIIRGIERALQEHEVDGKKVREIDTVLGSKLLGFDPYEIKELPAFQKFESDIQAKRWEIFEKLGE